MEGRPRSYEVARKYKKTKNRREIEEKETDINYVFNQRGIHPCKPHTDDSLKK